MDTEESEYTSTRYVVIRWVKVVREEDHGPENHKRRAWEIDSNL